MKVGLIKEQAITTAKKLANRTKNAHVVIHDPSNYKEQFNGNGYRVMTFESFLVQYGENAIRRIIYNTEEGLKFNYA